MGTRGAVGYRLGSIDKVTYNHFDSYPTGLGVAVLDYIRKFSDKEILEASRNIVLVEQDSKPTPEQKIECAFAKTADLTVSKQSTDDWYCLLRNIQGKLEAYHTGVRYMINSENFLGDSLFCEWAYIINLDTKTLEVYKGFNKNPKASGRYSNMEPADTNDAYYGVRLIREIPLKKIRSLKSVEALAANLER